MACLSGANAYSLSPVAMDDYSIFQTRRMAKKVLTKVHPPLNPSTQLGTALETCLNDRMILTFS
jgi:hypothetical protein